MADISGGVVDVEIWTCLGLTAAWIIIVYLYSLNFRTSTVTAISYGVAFAVVPLSHIWHILHGEGSLTDYEACAEFASFLDYGCIADIPSEQYWDTSNSKWYEGNVH